MSKATLFLPCHMMLFTKRVTSLSLKRGSGANGSFFACDLRILSQISGFKRISRITTPCPFFPLLFNLLPAPVHLFRIRGIRDLFFLGWSSFRACLFFLGSVLGTALFAVFNTGGIQRAAHNVVTYTRQV